MKLIVANWKMNPNTLGEAKRLFSATLKVARGTRVEAVICPPHVWILAMPKRKNSPWLGAQDVFWLEKGAYTGEVSPSMLKNIGCRYVIVGHSERKKYLGESDEMINRKVRAAVGAGLKVVLCVGEKERSGNSRSSLVDTIIAEQVTRAIENVSPSQLRAISVAYEPVWAIGTGKADSPDDALQAALLIRKVVEKKYSRHASQGLKVLYGGSVTTQNASEFSKQIGIDGLLVGGASLNPKEFKAILRQV